MKIFVWVLVVAAVASSAAAQLAAIGPDGKVRRDEGIHVLSTSVGPNTFGTSTLTAYTVSAFGFTGFDTTVTHAWNGGRYQTSGGELVANLTFPEGALVSAMELDACDTSATNQLYASFTRCASPGGGGCTVPAILYTGVAAAGGCSNFLLTFTPVVIDNVHNSYISEVGDPSDTLATKFNAVRFYYKLQVSPNDLGQQTFADVPPSHPFHRFIEALYASGITGGCAGGNFCPDAPVTRGQMAVFLATALGLHWAP